MKKINQALIDMILGNPQDIFISEKLLQNLLGTTKKTFEFYKKQDLRLIHLPERVSKKDLLRLYAYVHFRHGIAQFGYFGRHNEKVPKKMQPALKRILSFLAAHIELDKIFAAMKEASTALTDSDVEKEGYLNLIRTLVRREPAKIFSSVLVDINSALDNNPSFSLRHVSDEDELFFCMFMQEVYRSYQEYFIFQVSDKHEQIVNQLLLELTERQHQIIDMAFGLSGAPSKSNKDIAKALGFSPSYISANRRRTINIFRKKWFALQQD